MNVSGVATDGDASMLYLMLWWAGQGRFLMLHHSDVDMFYVVSVVLGWGEQGRSWRYIR